MRGLLTAIVLVQTLIAGTAFSQCAGTNMLDAMAGPDRTRLESAAALQPFHAGNFWRATKGGQEVILAGTYHLDDPRHAAVLESLAPMIDKAATVLVEAGPDEEQALKAAVARDPSLFVLTDASLPDLMGPTDWAALSGAMERRGIPGFMAAKFQPWYVTVMLAIPPCMMTMGQPDGLDSRIIRQAQAAGIPVRALEPYDTVFNLFGSMTLDEQVAMLRSSLALEARAEDYITTLADSYFAGNSRVIWELMRQLSMDMPGYTPEQVEADLEKMEQAMVIRRNRNWIPVIEAAAKDGPVFAAFGALHLPGADGIPRLLEQSGWTVTRLDP